MQLSLSGVDVRRVWCALEDTNDKFEPSMKRVLLDTRKQGPKIKKTLGLVREAILISD